MKNPLRSLVELFRPKNELTPMDLENMLHRLGGDHVSSAGIPVNVDNAQGLAAVGVCYRYLSDVLSTLPLELYRRTSTGNTRTQSREKARELRLYHRLKSKPNDFQTSTQWRKLGVRDLMFRGNWYNLKVPEFGGSFQFVRLHPDAVDVRQENDGSVLYLYRSRLGEHRYTRDQILHFWFDSDDGINGLSPIQVYRNTIGDGIALREHGSRFFRNAARLQYILQADKGVSMSIDDRKALLKDFESMYSGTENAHKSAFMPDGIKTEKVSISMEDAQWIEARKTSAREIFGIFGVPPHKGGDLGDATFSNIENENINAVIDAIAPKATSLEQGLNSSLFNDDGMFVKFTLAGMIRGDFKSRQEGLNIMRRAGVINANEWRGMEDFNARTDEGGDEYIVEQNMRIQNGNVESGNESV